MAEKKNKRFEDWAEVDCEDCECWWLNQCNGVQKAQKRSCTAFKATRRTDIPQEIKRLKTRLKSLTRALMLLAIAVLVHLIVHIVGGLL